MELGAVTNRKITYRLRVVSGITHQCLSDCERPAVSHVMSIAIFRHLRFVLAKKRSVRARPRLARQASKRRSMAVRAGRNTASDS